MRAGSLETAIIKAMVRPVRIFIMAIFIAYVYWETRQISLVTVLVLVGVIFDAFFSMLSGHYQTLCALHRGLEITGERLNRIEQHLKGES